MFTPWPESITGDKISLSGGATNEKLSVSKLVSLYRKEIPIQVRVCKGFCGPNEDTSISEGDNDRFNVHFIKHTKIVTNHLQLHHGISNSILVSDK